MARRKRTARSTAWADQHRPTRRPTALAQPDPRDLLRQIEHRNLRAKQARIRTMPPGGPLEPYVPAPVRVRTIWEAATNTPLPA